MNIIIGNDHAGTELKKKIVSILKNINYEVINVGTDKKESVDYPDYAHLVCQKINSENTIGILICGSGNGIAITANKYKNIRAAICWNKETASLSKKHNNANILCLPARFINEKEAIEIVTTFLNTSFEKGRHLKRLNKICI